MVTIPKLAQALADMLEVLGLPSAGYSLHSPRRGGATAAHKEGVTPEAVKRHGHRSSSAFWGYISAPAAANSTVAAALGAAVASAPILTSSLVKTSDMTRARSHLQLALHLRAPTQ